MRQQARDYYDRKIAGFTDSQDRIFKRNIPEDISNIKKIHLSGVCGTAVGSLASLLSKKGYTLSGSDTGCYPPMSDLIKELGIEFKEGFKEENVVGAELVVIGNVCGTNNPEAKYAREHNIPTLSLSEAIEKFFIKGKKSLVVAGTHGKTTTTGLLAHVFKDAGFKPGYMIGGVMQGGEESSAVGDGNYFIIEGDEYDTAYFDKAPKFLHYAPYSTIITSLEFDHVDIYKDLKEYTEAFEFLVQEIPPEGNLFIYNDGHCNSLASFASCKVFLYGLGSENSNGIKNNITARDIVVTEKGQEFSLIVEGVDMGKLFTPLPGTHNLLNTLAVAGVALQEGMSIETLREGLASFGGMKRRQEVVAEIKGITVLDDFAHHPTAVRETISAIKSKYPGRRLVAFFEPRSATSRRKVFEEEYGKSFGQAELVFVSTPPLKETDSIDNFINPAHIMEIINASGIEAYAVQNADELLEKALPLLKEGDVILIMSNGSFDSIHKKLAVMLSS
ncbi:MAG: Mur ligase family protein [Candidatus Paceibacterota bacterium]|jgi:UDP-N-acetylmuramate: L-alanyl-gamma-D-glutamyl-meso-diaminopimelate ligase